MIKNAQMFQNIQDRLSELATIYEIGMALTSTLDLEQLLSLIAKNSTQSLRAQGCTIRLMNLPEIASHKTFSSYSVVGDTISWYWMRGSAASWRNASLGRRNRS